MRIYGTTLTFINSHLAAHMKHVAARNRNCEEILDNMRLGIAEDGSASTAEAKYIDADVLANHCFWFGDMNYRVDLAITKGGERNVDDKEKRMQVMDAVSRRDLSSLLAADQLQNELSAGHVLHGFREAEITFDPTFKVERTPGTTYKAQRVPSWCDRVLWKSQPSLSKDVTCTAYQSHPTLRTSDHKPVSATFSISCRKFPDRVESRGTTRVKLSGVCGEGLLGMDVSGLSDVYLLLHTLPNLVQSRGQLKSRVKNQTLSPVCVTS